MEFFFNVPGYLILRHGRRRLADGDKESVLQQMRRMKAEHAGGMGDDVPIWGFWRQVYSYPQLGPVDGNRASWLALTAMIAQIIAVASYSLWELLIVLVLAFGENEFSGELGGAFIKSWESGTGFSSITGWLSGFLVAKLLFKTRNWLSYLGVQTLISYGFLYYTDQSYLPKVSHACHFSTLLEGFLLGVTLTLWGPKPNPVKIFANYSGYLAIFFCVLFEVGLLEYFLARQFPDAPKAQSLADVINALA